MSLAVVKEPHQNVFYNVVLDVEYLPDQRVITTQISVNFSDHATAQQSCEYLNQRYPDARVAIVSPD